MSATTAWQFYHLLKKEANLHTEINVLIYFTYRIKVCLFDTARCTSSMFSRSTYYLAFIVVSMRTLVHINMWDKTSGFSVSSKIIGNSVLITSQNPFSNFSWKSATQKNKFYYLLSICAHVGCFLEQSLM